MNASRTAIVTWLFFDSGVDQLDESTLSPSEQERLSRYRTSKAKRQFQFSRCVGRELFGQMLSIPAREVSWNPSGPPTIANDKGKQTFSVSVSHSGGWTVIAVGPRTVDIGVDIEVRHSRLNWDAIATVALGSGEKLEFDMWNDEQKKRLLPMVWTMKEAAFKALRGVQPGSIRDVTFCRDEFRELSGNLPRAISVHEQNQPLCDKERRINQEGIGVSYNDEAVVAYPGLGTLVIDGYGSGMLGRSMPDWGSLAIRRLDIAPRQKSDCREYEEFVRDLRLVGLPYFKVERLLKV
ncbi:4'-phosphopantetheinyl transferase family protein [Planctomicrobium sp. SH668]|uniref:4'-phosphopantetheinyl transferase family protein n=1 Tax=Planctomicrobium sp. SH668 TaxID=3448126 RepID=UPI003F5C5BE3